MKSYLVLQFVVALVLLNADAAAQILPGDALARHSVEVIRQGAEYKFYQDGLKLKSSHVRDFFSISPEATRELKRAYTNRFFGRSLAGAGTVLFGLGTAALVSDANDWEASAVVMTVGAGIALCSIPLLKAYNKRASLATDYYNRALIKNIYPPRSSLRLDVQPGVLSIAMAF